MARRFKTADLEAGVVWTIASKTHHFPNTTRQSSGLSSSPTKLRTPRDLGSKFRTQSVDTANEPSHHVRSPIPFHKQTPRPDISRMGPGVNENRFNVVPEFSPIYSKTRRVCTPSIAKSIPRKSSVPRGVDLEPVYAPQYNLIWKKLTKTLHFDKTLSRKKLAAPALDLVYDKVSYKQVTPKVPSPDFRHARQESGPCELPVFMRGLTSWQAMHTLNEKMLRMNRFYPETEEGLYRSAVGGRMVHGRASSVGH